MAESDCCVFMGSNMAENHPVAFRWPMKAKANGAKLIHVDPRFTRTSAMCDIYAPIRAGSDIAFLGGLVNYVINNERWNKEQFFQDFLVHYTNAPMLISDEFQDTEDLDGVFSGLMQYKEKLNEWPYNGFVGEYNNQSWQYAGTQAETQGWTGDTARSGEQEVGKEQAPPGGSQAAGAKDGEAQKAAAKGPPFEPLVRALLKPPPTRDETLKNPRCVFQIVKRHFSRYTPEMVESVTGCPQATFLKVAETILANSGPDRTTSFAYAVAWTQHTNGPQVIGCCALLQLLLGNIGRPGAGIMALRGHASIQGSTDIPTLYHSIHGYMAHPTALKKHDTLPDYMAAETKTRSYWANLPKFMVSYMKSMYGDAATVENGFGYDWHPKIIGDHSHMAMFAAMAEGKVRGMLLIGQNPATSLNAKLERAGMRRLEWLVVKDNWVHESATFWKNAPEIKNGEINSADIKTEIFFFPSTQVAEYEGSFTNTFRMLQWHYKAADPPGDCRSDLWFTHQLAKRLKKLYGESNEPRDAGFKNLTWDFDPDQSSDALRAQTASAQAEGGTVGGATTGGTASSAAGSSGAAPGAAKDQPPGSAPAPGTPQHNPGEPDGLKILREINGYYTGDPNKHVAGFADLKDDGSTTCASWIYCGVFPKPGENRSANRKPDPLDAPGGAQLGWGYTWPANRRIMYNRASADLQGNPWSERKKYIWWDGKRWTGYDVPDFAATKPPTAKAQPKGIGLDAQDGTDPFIMLDGGVGWLYVPTGLVDGPLPTHYEPAESPVKNPLYKQQSSPVLKYWKTSGNPLAPAGDAKYPHVITTYRLTEHYLAGAMSRWNPWLTELQPELFIELSPELAQEKGIRNLDWVRISSPRTQIRAKALVTRRMRPLQINGKTVHQVGMPWHWGYEGLSTGDVVNELTALVGDPNVSIHEGKAFVCNVEKA
ncbi:MAG TPA: molybdopterin-dependent oxidoreductase [Candidatus Polarisedimenticolaceae bacterium]|nr:molybdopterin-dependent oxidoreductase [Candidatus Polarisedimenticolaceae bacterium]